MELRLGPAQVRFTGRADGDLRRTAPPTARRAVVDLPWTVLRQVHGADVVVVDAPGAEWGTEADAAVTTAKGAALAVLTADCAPVALASDEGVVAVVHAGWRGLVSGVVGAAVDTMRRLGATRVRAALGPCIRAECYEFGAADLELAVRRLGPEVRAESAHGRPALDLAAGVRAVLERADATLEADVVACTACDGERWFSHRARHESERQAAVVWRA